MRAFLENTFHLSPRRTTAATEIAAGITTFSTMAYLLAVNPQILKEAGMDFGAVMAATAIASALASLWMGLFANYPFALGPGMGLNAYFTYGIVLGLGASWQTALAACFFAGAIFFILNLAGVREKIMNAIPLGLRIATGGGIGIFLAFIGFKNVKLIEPHAATYLALGKIMGPEVLLTAFGVIVITALQARGVKCAIIIAILLNWAIGLACGLVKWQGLVAWPPSLAPTFLQLDLQGALTLAFIPVILSFVFVALFDTAGTLLSLAEQGRFLDKKGHLPRAAQALFADAVGTLSGSLLGTSALTTYLESASGIAAGGRTGLTSITVAFLFLLSLFFSPFAASIPAFATAPALITIGAMMLSQASYISRDDPTEYIPAFIILVTIPLTFSIATGIALGFIIYPLIKLLSGKVREVSPMVWIIACLFLLRFIYL